jgi:hypothetical protein
MAAGSISDTRYQAHRLRVSVEVPFDEFRRRFEAAVPAFDAEAFAALVRRKADWSEMVALMDASSPHGFLNYWSLDAGSLMSVAGDAGQCVEYLMGNHVIAERMYRYDPMVLLHAPLRPVIASHDGGATHFMIEQPSAIFSSFDDERIAEVGVELDRKVAGLLADLDAPVPPSLAR